MMAIFPCSQEIEGVEQFEKIVDNIGETLKLPPQNITGIKLAAGGKGAKKDTLAFECAMKDDGLGKIGRKLIECQKLCSSETPYWWLSGVKEWGED